MCTSYHKYFIQFRTSDLKALLISSKVKDNATDEEKTKAENKAKKKAEAAAEESTEE